MAVIFTAVLVLGGLTFPQGPGTQQPIALAQTGTAEAPQRSLQPDGTAQRSASLARAQLTLLEVQKRQHEEWGEEQVQLLKEQAADQIEQIKVEANRQIQQTTKQLTSQIEQGRRQVKRQAEILEAQMQILKVQAGIQSEAGSILRQGFRARLSGAPASEARARNPQAAVSASLDDKLSRILDRLERLEKRLDGVEKRK